MNWLIKALSSSIGKKYVMALSGLLLCGFLVVHLAGNLLLYVGPEAYNKYAHTLHSQEWFVKIAESGLVVLFAAHILLAIGTHFENRRARGRDYYLKESKLDTVDTAFGAPFRAENWMIWSGIIVLIFLLVHLSDFTFGIRLQGAPDEEPYDKAVRILHDSWSFWVYLIGCVVLGIHLTHGFASAFQSLGINHPKYNTLIHWVGIGFGVVIGLAFASFPLWRMLLYQSAGAE